MSNEIDSVQWLRDLAVGESWAPNKKQILAAADKLEAAYAAMQDMADAAHPRISELESKLGEVTAELAATKGGPVSCEEHSWVGDDDCAYCAVEDRTAKLNDALSRLHTAREALCQIANGIPGPCLHATEALQSIAVEKRDCIVPGCAWSAMPGRTHCGIHAEV